MGPDESETGVSGSQRKPRPRSTTAADAGVVLGVLVLLLLVPLAAIITAAQPVPPARELTAQALPAARSTAALRPLPDGLPIGFLPTSVVSLRPYAVAALGETGAGALASLLVAEQLQQESSIRDAAGDAVYPYRYPALTRLLDRAPERGRTAAAGRLGAALTLVATRTHGDDSGPEVNAAAAAFAVLERARAAGDCAAQINLLLLLTADKMPRDRPVRDETRRAEQACPHDPTPLWLLGQYLSQRAARVIQFDVGDPIPRDATGQAEAAVERLAREFPGSVPALTGVADNHLRAGLRLAAAQPFTARQRLRAAAEGYLAARDLDPDAAVPGLARALIALGEPVRAADTVRPLTWRTKLPGPLLEVLTVAEEEAHRYALASAAGRDLAARGDRAYPSGRLLFPVPGNVEQDLAQDPNGPLSTGTSTHLSFTVDLQAVPGGAGGSVDDVSFIPAYRPSASVGPDPDCPALGWRRDAILAGQAAAALEGLPTDEDAGPVRPRGYCRLRGADLRDLARLETGRQIEEEREWVVEDWQNLFRWAGDLPHAERAARVWAARADAADPLPWQRLGEVLFLQGRYDEAANAFGAAARRTRAAHYDDDLATWGIELSQGACLLRGARAADGLTMLRAVAANGESGAVYRRQIKNAGWADREAAVKFATMAYHARGQIADAEREAGRLWDAIDNYDAARELLPHLTVDDPAALRPERLDANRSLAELALGWRNAAAQSAARALQADPANPAFLMNAGFVADRSGRYRTAARHDAAALANDPGAFPAANDLGVALARLGRHDEAVDALRRAVGARPDYALGWFNLGVVYGMMGPLRFLASQGALARAFALNDKLRDAPRTPTTDLATYRTGLDLSKPVPPRWSLAGLPATSPVPAAGLLAVLLLGLTLARAAGAQGPAQQWLETIANRADRGPSRAVWAIAATASAFAVSALLHGRGPLAETLCLVLGVLLLCAVVVRSRGYAARRAGAVAEQRSWTPGIAFGLVTSAVLAPWAPLPVTRPASAAPRVHTVAPVALGLIGLVLFVEAAAFGVPVVRLLATATLVMVASMLVPVAPLDGAQINRTGVLAGAGALGAAVLLSLAVV